MLELLFYKEIYYLIANEVEVTKENADEIIQMPIIQENLPINKIDREIKDIIDAAISKYGFNGFLNKLVDLQNKITKQLDLLSNSKYKMLSIAIDCLYERVAKFYEGIIYPIILKWFIKLSNHRFSINDFLKDCQPDIAKDTKLLFIGENSYLEQISLNGEEPLKHELNDLFYSIDFHNRISNQVIKKINQIFTKQEIIKYGQYLITVFIDNNSDEITLDLFVRTLDRVVKYKPPIKKTENNQLQLKLPGF